VLGDLPTSVWWTEDLSQSPPVMALVAMGRQFVYDSRQWRDVRAGLSTIVALLGRPHLPDLADVNWRRLAPMRQALQHGLRSLPAIGGTPMRIHVRHDRQDTAKAWLLAGWLASSLGPQAPRDLVTTVDPSDVDGQPLSVAIERADGAAALLAEMNDAQVVVRDTSTNVPFAVKVPSESLADAVAAELHALGRDATLIAAIRTAHERLISAA
jgi:glucose-6-phosphate dehydrogenase assembly protein OpcA